VKVAWLMSLSILFWGGCGQKTATDAADFKLELPPMASIPDGLPLYPQYDATDWQPGSPAPDTAGPPLPPFTDTIQNDGQATDAGDAEPPDGIAKDGEVLPMDATICPEGQLCTLKYTAYCDEARCNENNECVATPIPGCCTKDLNCETLDGLGPCETVRCVANECTVTAVPGCCVEHTDCATTLPCAIGECNEFNRCTYCPADCNCTSKPPTISKSMDGATLAETGFSSTDYAGLDDVRWQPSEYRYFKEPSSLYLGNPTCKTYYTGLLDENCQVADGGLGASQVRLMLYSPVFNLKYSPGDAGTAAVFWIWSDVEPNLGLGTVEPDVLRVYVDMLDGSTLKWPVASSLDVGKHTQGEWRPIAVDLTPFSGTIFRLRMEFDTFDGQLNSYEGIYLDEFQLVDKCQHGCCIEDADCPIEPDPCLKPRCVPMVGGTESICVSVPKNIGEPCSNCTADGQCDDGNPCTSNTCLPEGVCKTEAFCCFEQTIFFEDFEDQLAKWSSTQEDADVFWQVSGTTFMSPDFSLWFGNLTTGTYEGADSVSGMITSTTIFIPSKYPDGAQPAVTFWLNLDTEWSGVFYDNPGGIDRLALTIVSSGKETELWSSDAINGTTQGEWLQFSASLTPFVGSTVSFRWSFQSVDGSANHYSGAQIDDFRVLRSCAPASP
jgi:hypothetical protein